VVDIDPGPRSQRDVGIALLRAKRFNEAIEPLRNAQQAEETAEGFVYLIDAFTAAGNAAEAEQQRGLYRQHLARVRNERVRGLGGH
jgi:uncharacterized protein HemY